MATKVIVCPECESPLVPGRFSCQGCGAVVAAVASVSRSFARAEPTVPPVLEPAAPGAEPEWEADGPPPADVDDYDAGSTVEAAEPSVEPTWPDPTAVPPAAAPRAAAPPPVAADAWPMAAAAQAAGPAAPSWPAQPAWPPNQAMRVTAEPAVRTPAGAYLPPSAVLPSGEALPAGRSAAPRRSLAERFALGEEDGPLGLAATLPGRTIALGAAIAGLGFLLPWAEVVIGSGGLGGFLDQWGLAGPGHWLLLLLLMAVGGLAVAGERTSVKVGTSTAAIAVGALLFGITFPYVMGPFREAVGVYVTLAGALVMIAGGLIARATPRHATVAESV